MTLATQQIDFDELPEDIGAIGVMGKDGDTKHVWDPKKPEEVREARLLYDTLKKAGYLACRMKRSSRGEVMTEFDPNAKRILFVPPFAGG